MPWRYEGIDNFIEVVVDPDASCDLLSMAKDRPVWVVDTSGNKSRIDHIWSVGSERRLW